MRLALIVNPAASSVTARTRVMMQRALATRHDLTVLETTRRGHATRLAHRSVKEGAEVVITLGGDGTVNEAANGLIGTDTILAPLPGGSTNVFARSLGFPNDAVEATGVLINALEPENRSRSVAPGSLGIANGRAFVFHVGMGFDANVVHRVERRSPLKKYLGHPWFIACALATLLSPTQRQLGLDVVSDDGRRVRGAKMAVAMNVNPYTFLGNRAINLAPEASLATPLSVVATTSMSPTSTGPGLWGALTSSEQGLPDAGVFSHWSDVGGLTVSSPRPFAYQLDGEPVTPVHSLRLESRPDALRFVQPSLLNSDARLSAGNQIPTE